MKFLAEGPDVPEELIQRHEDGRVVFFCGAGVSCQAGLPTFEELVCRVAKEFDSCGEISEIENPADKINHLESIEGREEVRKKIFDIMSKRGNNNGGKAYRNLLSLSTSEDRVRMVTTNFDCMFEQHDDGKVRYRKYTAPALPVPNAKWSGLVYLHGLLPDQYSKEELDNLIISSQDFGRGYLLERWASRFVCELFRTHTVCFIGYSLEDTVMRYLLDAYASESSNENTGIYIFARDGNANMQRKGINYILYDRREHRNLYCTINEWANLYSKGIRGKKATVARILSGPPNPGDPTIGLLKWALSDTSGEPAKFFAEWIPTPSLEWLDVLGDIPNSSSWIKSIEKDEVKNEKILQQLSFWLLGHIGNRKVLLFLKNHDGKLSQLVKDQMISRLVAYKKLQDAQPGSLDDTQHLIKRIMEENEDAKPDIKLRKLLIACALGWVSSGDGPRIEQNHLFELMEEGNSLLPLTEYLSKSFAPKLNPYTEAGDSVKCEIVLNNANFSMLSEMLKGERKDVIEILCDVFGKLLAQAFDMLRYVGMDANENNLSSTHLRSIKPHSCNGPEVLWPDWIKLVDLLREAWDKEATNNPKHASSIVREWARQPYSIFRRLVYYAIAHGNVICIPQAYNWLMYSKGKWLVDKETRVEALQAVFKIAPALNENQLLTLKNFISSMPENDDFDRMKQIFLSVIDRQRQQDLSNEDIISSIYPDSRPRSESELRQMCRQNMQEIIDLLRLNPDDARSWGIALEEFRRDRPVTSSWVPIAEILIAMDNDHLAEITEDVHYWLGAMVDEARLQASQDNDKLFLGLYDKLMRVEDR